VRDVDSLEEDIARTAEVLIRTTGDGGTRGIIGEPRVDAAAAPIAVDILGATLSTTGPELGLGHFQDAVLTFDDGVVVLGRDEASAMLAIVAESGVAAGLLLNQIRRLLRTRQDVAGQR